MGERAQVQLCHSAIVNEETDTIAPLHYLTIARSRKRSNGGFGVGEGFHNARETGELEHFFDVRLHARESQVAALLSRGFDGVEKHAQARAAGIVQAL